MQRSATGRTRAFPHKNCKQPGLKQPGLGNPKAGHKPRIPKNNSRSPMRPSNNRTSRLSKLTQTPFLVVEGIDSAAKTFHAELVQESLEEKKAHYIEKFGGTPPLLDHNHRVDVSRLKTLRRGLRKACLSTENWHQIATESQMVENNYCGDEMLPCFSKSLHA